MNEISHSLPINSAENHPAIELLFRDKVLKDDVKKNWVEYDSIMKGLFLSRKSPTTKKVSKHKRDQFEKILFAQYLANNSSPTHLDVRGLWVQAFDSISSCLIWDDNADDDSYSSALSKGAYALCLSAIYNTLIQLRDN